MGELTGGIVDVDGRHGDGTVRYVVPETDPRFQKKVIEEDDYYLAPEPQKTSEDKVGGSRYHWW